jgi:hypothetical protein
VFYKDRMSGVSRQQSQCEGATEVTFRRLPPDEAFVPPDCDDTVIRGLVAKNFRVLEDGVEQEPQDVTFEAMHHIDARDNLGDHMEWSETPAGKWSTVETPPGIVRGPTLYLYRVAYRPTQSAEGSCHRVEVKVDRPDAFVYARSQYCRVQHAPRDPLNRTPFGQHLESKASSGKQGKLGLSLQAGFFYTHTNLARVELVLDFPWNSLQRKWRNGSLYATIGVMGLIYRKDGTLVARFSDFGCCPSDRPGFVATDGPHLKAAPFLDAVLVPTRFETQIDLQPGEYNLQIVLSDGSKFGRAKAPLSIEGYDEKHLAISSVVLCNRFRNAAVAAKETSAFNLTPQYVPLVSKGVQFTPTGGTHIGKGEPLFAYFEVYEPVLGSAAATGVQTQVRLIDVTTGELKADTGWRSAVDWMQPGESVIPIADQIAVDKLPTGSYRLEVQATDSAGRNTAWRTANFTIQ